MIHRHCAPNQKEKSCLILFCHYKHLSCSDSDSAGRGYGHHGRGFSDDSHDARNACAAFHARHCVSEGSTLLHTAHCHKRALLFVDTQHFGTTAAAQLAQHHLARGRECSRTLATRQTCQNTSVSATHTNQHKHTTRTGSETQHFVSRRKGEKKKQQSLFLHCQQPKH